MHVVTYPDDRAVVGRAFNVGDEAPLPLAEHLDTALTALGYRPGRFLPTLPRLTSALLWLFRHVPDRVLLEPVNRRLATRWEALAARTRAAAAIAPRVDREALHWIAADHYYDTSRLERIGWRPLHPVSTPAGGRDNPRAPRAEAPAGDGRPRPARVVAAARRSAEWPRAGRACHSGRLDPATDVANRDRW